MHACAHALAIMELCVAAELCVWCIGVQGDTGSVRRNPHGILIPAAAW